MIWGNIFEIWISICFCGFYSFCSVWRVVDDGIGNIPFNQTIPFKSRRCTDSWCYQSQDLKPQHVKSVPSNRMFGARLEQCCLAGCPSVCPSVVSVRSRITLHRWLLVMVSTSVCFCFLLSVMCACVYVLTFLTSSTSSHSFIPFRSAPSLLAYLSHNTFALRSCFWPRERQLNS